MSKKDSSDSRFVRIPVQNSLPKAISRSKKRGESLQGSGDIFRTLIENFHEVVFTMDLQGRFTYINQVIEKLTGCKVDQVVGSTFKRFIYLDDLPGLTSSFKRTLAGQPEPYEFRILSGNGEILHVHSSSSLIQEDGKAVGFAGVMIEISKLKQAEQAVLETEGKYHTLVEQIPAAVYSDAIDDPSKTICISPQIERISGYTPEEWIANSDLWANIIHPEDLEKVWAEHLETNRTGERFLVEYRMIARDGHVVWVRDEATILHDSKGKPLCWQGVMLDISEQKQAEVTLLQRTEELAAFQATALDLAQQQDLSSLLNTIVERSKMLLKAPFGFIYLYAQKTNDLELTVELGSSGTPGERLKMGEGMAGRVAQTRQTLIVDDYSTWEGRSSIFKDMPYHAIIEVPMLFGGQLIGVLGVYDSSEMKCKFTQADAHILELFAGQAASLVHDARLVQGLQSELTTRKQVEDSLREAEAHYRALVEQIPAIVYSDSAEQIGHTIYVSPQIKTMLGFDPEEWSVNNDLWNKAIHPDDHERVLAEYDRTFNQGETFSTEYRMISSSGQIIWVRDKAVLIRDQSGHPLFWQGIMSDITERRQAAQALEESEERYRQLFDLSPDAIAVHHGGRILLANAAAMNIVGATTPEEIIGKPMLDFVHPDYRKLVIERTRQQIAEGKVVPVMEEKFIRLDGTEIDVEVTAAPIHFQNTLASLVIFRDITERKRAQALQEAVYRIAVSTETTKSLNDLFPQIHGIISSVMPADNFYITLYDEEHNVLRFQYFKDDLDEPYLNEIQPGQGLTAYVLRTGKSLLCTQAVHNELERQGSVKLLGVPSAIWLGVPLIIEGKTIGAMVVQHYSDPDAYGEGDQHMLEFVSTQVAVAINRKQAEDALQRQLSELTVLHAVSNIAANASSVDQLVEQVTQIIGNAVYVDDFGVALFDQENRGLRPHPSYHGKSIEAMSLIPLSTGIVGYVASTGELYCAADVRSDPHYLNTLPETRSELCVPIKVGNKLIGVINAESRQLNFFREEDERLFNTIAGTLATAIEKLHLFDAERTRRQEAETLREAAAAVASSLELDQVLNTILISLKRVVPYDSASVILLDGENLRLMAVQGFDHPEKLINQIVPSKDFPFRKNQKKDKPIILADARADSRFQQRAETGYVRGWMGVPLTVRKKVIGYITLNSRKPSAYHADSAALVQAFANQGANAIENARLYDQAIQAAERRAILHRASQEIAQASQDPEQVYAAVHRAAVQLMPAEALAITLLEEQSQETVGVYLVDKAGRSPVDRFPGSVGLSGLVISTGKSVITNDLTVDPIPGSIHFGEEGEVRSILAVPLRLGEKVIGMLSVQSYQPHAYTDDDQALLEMLSAHAAVAVENARLYEETFQRLKELQAVNHISTALRTAQTVDDMLPSLLDETLKVLGSDSGVIWLYDPVGGVLKENVSRGWFATLKETPLKPGDGIAGTVFKTGQVSVSKEFATDPLTLESVRARCPVGWGGACVPIRTGRETIGVLFVSVELPRQLQPDAVHLLVTLSEMAGIAIRRATLHDQTERQLQRLASLRAVDMAINTILDLRVTLGILIDHIISQLKVDAVNILLINPNSPTLYCAASSGFRSDAFKNTRLYISDSLAGQAIRTRTTIHISNLSDSKLLQRGQVLADEGFVTYFGVPLIAKGQMKGVLETFHRSPMEPDSEWRSFLETLAGQAAIAIDNSVLFEELQQTNMNLSLAYDATIEGWSKALDLRSQETEGHTLRVTEMTLQLADIMGINSADLVHIRRGALLHDIGEMGVPESILNKAGPLTEEEWILMRRHPEFAFEMLSPITFLLQALDIPFGHHERWDGSGYPRHLSGEQVPLAARIFAVVDVWDASISARPYRKALTKAAATEFVRKNIGKLFDPRVVETFLRMIAGPPVPANQSRNSHGARGE